MKASCAMAITAATAITHSKAVRQVQDMPADAPAVAISA